VVDTERGAEVEAAPRAKVAGRAGRWMGEGAPVWKHAPFRRTGAGGGAAAAAADSSVFENQIASPRRRQDCGNRSQFFERGAPSAVARAAAGAPR
jgi:hypothetical protein